MIEFLKVGFKEISTLSGLKYTCNNLDEGARCVELYNRKFTIFLGYDEVNEWAVFYFIKSIKYLFIL